MRVFQTECKDDKTGYSMVLSECSYNMAMYWLEDMIKKLGHTSNIECHKEESGLIRIETSGRTFFYDEERGYLLGE